VNPMSECRYGISRVLLIWKCRVWQIDWQCDGSFKSPRGLWRRFCQYVFPLLSLECAKHEELRNVIVGLRWLLVSPVITSSSVEAEYD